MKTINIPKDSYRQSVLQFAADKYKTEPEYLWASAPGYAVLRHSDNKKWYAIIMNVPKEKLGLSGKEYIDILDIKIDPVLAGSLQMKKGFMPAYHMHKGNWITVLLDGSVDKEMIYFLLEMSFDLTASKKAQK
ncbi:MAG: MmcQ/YjbR family DNA-binding protein [Oscillospiraceae bacterium]|nr:MmcQ/YjbR family DNA-binding protein [Oscillospiraceae bacterium]